MNQTRYCSTCGTLLSEGAAICGECGARYQASPYEKRATDAPGAWSAPPRPRSRAEQGQERSDQEDEGIELIRADSLRSPQPGATALRSEEQYDRVMVTQPPMNQPARNQPGQSPGMPGGPGASASGPGSAPGTAPGAAPEGAPAAASFEPPLDGCAPATPLKRFLAALIDTVIATLVTVPFLIGFILIVTSQSASTTSMILIGVGTALPAAYHLVMIWLVGAKGFTLGKLILGLRVTRLSEGGALGFVRALGRWAVYALFPLLMALSIFFDPRKLLRGFHDRAIDSVVTDIKAGRNPLQPRPDDFERAGAEHYLGAPSVAVSTHENLLSEPGAAWRDQGASPVQPVDGAQGPSRAPRARTPRAARRPLPPRLPPRPGAPRPRHPSSPPPTAAGPRRPSSRSLRHPRSPPGTSRPRRVSPRGTSRRPPRSPRGSSPPGRTRPRPGASPRRRTRRSSSGVPRPPSSRGPPRPGDSPRHRRARRPSPRSPRPRGARLRPRSSRRAGTRADTPPPRSGAPRLPRRSPPRRRRPLPPRDRSTPPRPPGDRLPRPRRTRPRPRRARTRRRTAATPRATSPVMPGATTAWTRRRACPCPRTSATSRRPASRPPISRPRRRCG
ncbi:RDD family protein [Brachybacterium paraconglomeratum]|uniref:RDD family protein n=1 Tax=Brachybacterium paraconglomeratum TaxID=173362 RepID=UPI0031ED5D65